MSEIIDLAGKRFGRLTVIKENGRKYSQVAWACRCDCGHITTVCGASLRAGDSQSCGCLQKEIARRKPSIEAKIKMSKAKKGKPLSREHKRKISIATKGKNNPNYGKHFSKESKAKMSKSAMGRRASKEAREKMSRSRKGRTFSEEQKNKISESLKGKYVGENHWNFGTHPSEETKIKMSNAQKGKIHSEKAKAKMSKTRKSKNLKGLFKGELSHNWKGGKNFAVFDTFAPQISWCNDVRRNPNDKAQLQIRCTLCGKWFCPTRSRVYNRIAAINNNNIGDGNFYCSDKCKQACPVFSKHLHRKNQAPLRDRYGQKEWRKHVMVCAEYACEICGKIIESGEAHHIKPISQHPLESMDIDNGLYLCKDCHKMVHSEIGCRPVDLRCQP